MAATTVSQPGLTINRSHHNTGFSLIDSIDVQLFALHQAPPMESLYCKCLDENKNIFMWCSSNLYIIMHLHPVCLCFIFPYIFCSLCIYWFCVLFWKYRWKHSLHPSPRSREVASTKGLLIVALLWLRISCQPRSALFSFPVTLTASCSYVQACLCNCVYLIVSRCV